MTVVPPATDDDVPATPYPPRGDAAVDIPAPEPATTDDPKIEGPVDDPGAADAPDEAPRAGAAADDGPADDEPTDPLPTRDRLLQRLLGEATLTIDATRRSRVLGWALPLAVMLFGGILRFLHLGTPHQLVFDETYYVKDAYSLLQNGYEANWDDNSNPAFESGDGSGLRTDAEYVVHPLVGKWLIALGMHLGGGMDSSVAWRLSAAVFGTLAVLMTARIGRRLFASTAWGTVAGLFVAVDGQAIVMSRVSLLDGFLMFFCLAAFGCLLLDRDQARRRLADRISPWIDEGRDLAGGPGLGMRWWRLAAAVMLGLACGTKWSGLYFVAVFGLMTVAWDMAARKIVGVRGWVSAAVVKDGLVAFVVMVGGTFVVYLATWTTWFTHSGGWNRQWAAQNPGQGVQWLPESLRSLWKYHQDMWAFHTGLDTPHSYAAHPLGWIVQWRPTSMYYPTEISGLTGQQAQDACGSTACSQPIVALGNPLLWWAAAAAILVAVVWLLRYRDWRAFAVLSGILAGWVPWFQYPHRTIFTFYSVAFVPWIALTLAYVLSLIVGPPDTDPRGRRRAIIAVTAVVTLIVAAGLWFYPVWAGWIIPYDQWHARMWLQSWV
ncbi:phospholipid carrier-dependent glycosyltransferase [Cellulomonas sp. JH27-2]|uniref:dolichyl-phosphate-mannose--protein mannosyltransferase n=1 Tax=Cellulomonas sp. JH27-2 TaxID=2774139 RepID=UPI0017834603|nr:phospholipid carrier-dependent glycosyltransferase [Cellulomonas sp. JH27-2]MBD8059568.1 phospholipid carrier-dependent glycosyltransferase [Cellulomonas sp. JH27-2]